jgi:hypothetical protein
MPTHTSSFSWWRALQLVTEKNPDTGFRYLIKNESGGTVMDTLRPVDRQLLDSENPKAASQLSGSVRYGKKTKYCFECFAVADSNDYLKSSRKFKKQMDFVLDSMKLLEQDLQKHYENLTNRTNRLVHNLVTLNAKNIQEIASIASLDSFSGDVHNLLKRIESSISGDLAASALATLKVAKNNTAIKGEISVFQKLYKQEPLLTTKKHVMHKVFMNAYYPFAPDFIDKNVRVRVDQSDCKGFFDYESIQVALIHLLENSAKYTLPGSVVEVSFNTSSKIVSILMKMQSLRIHPEEKEKIFLEGYSGKYASDLTTAGSGTGLFLAKKILELNKGSIIVTSDSSNSVEKMGVNYDFNTIELSVPQAL